MKVHLLESLYLNRRALTEGQKAALGSKIRELLKPAAKERQKEGKNLGLNLGQGSTADQAAKIVGTSATNIKKYDEIKRKSPEILEYIDTGRITLHRAYTIMKENEKPVSLMTDFFKETLKAEKILNTQLEKIYNELSNYDKEDLSFVKQACKGIAETLLEWAHMICPETNDDDPYGLL